MILEDCKKCNLCEVFRNCEDNNKDEFSRLKEIFLLKKKSSIVKAGFPVDGFYILKSGFVKVLKSGYNEKKQIIRLCKPGDVIGHRALNRDYYPIDAVALTDVHVCFFDINVFHEILLKNPQLAYYLLTFLADELYESEKKARNYAMMNVRESIISALLYIDSEFKNIKGIPVLSRLEIAEIAATTKEQASKYLNELNEDKLIKIKGKKISILQKDKLEKSIEQYA